MHLLNLFLGRNIDAVRIFTLYSEAKFNAKFFLLLRMIFTPFQKMSNELPIKGRILDQGCGHGIFSVQLALAHPERFVVGIDHDENRIELAQSVAKKLKNLEFINRSLTKRDEELTDTFEGVALIDVLHYFSKEEQISILKNAFELLRSGGIIIFREVNPAAGLVSKINFLWEKIATLSKFTKTINNEIITFRTPSEWEKLLHEVGFLKVESKSCSSILFADVLFKGIKA